MFFLARIARLIFDLLPWAIVYHLPPFILLAALLIVRRRAVERRVLGQSQTPFWKELTVTTVVGVLAGYAGTMLLLSLGITIDISGLNFLLPVALLLMLIDLRYLCLAYAGGLLSLASLITGLPKLHIPGLLALIAVLHLTESALIAVAGGRQALPVYIKHKGKTVGGFLLQQVWPIPLIVLTVVMARAGHGEVYLRVPAWWPLIPLSLAGSLDLVFTPVSVAAALGYSDLALTAGPRIKANRTAGLLGLYSGSLLALALLSARVPVLAWAASIFAPAGHELVLYLARRHELSGKPAFGQVPGGVAVLSVLPGTLAAKAGLRPGEVIISVDGRPVRSKAEFNACLNTAGREISLVVAPCSWHDGRSYQLRAETGRLGLILAPDPDEPAQANVGRWRFFGRRRETWT
ncbi:MAG: PDZ domain-containing protein [Bacteroidota bacterium]